MKERTRIKHFHLTVIITVLLATVAFTSASPSTNYHGPNGIYNPSIAPCPNNPTLVGYATLSSLRSDLSNYFLSLTTSPTTSPAPTPSPSATPTHTPSEDPTSAPTHEPSEIPTKAPITFRPTKFPISAIFVANRKEPTRSPSPTVEMIIIGMGGGSSSGPGGRKMGAMPPAPSPRRMSDGQRGEGRNRIRVHEEPLSRGNDILASKIDGKATAEETAIYKMASNAIGDGTAEIGDETADMDSNVEKPPDLRFSSNNDPIDDPNSRPIIIAIHKEEMPKEEEWQHENPSNGDTGTSGGSTVAPPMMELVAAPLAVNEEKAPDEITARTGPREPDPDSEISHSNQSMEALYYRTEALADFHTRDRDDGHLLEDGELVTFNVCPNSQFSFDDATDDNDGPLTLETPLRNPISIHCLPDSFNNTNCAFTGGSTHLLIHIHLNTYVEYDYEMSTLPSGHSISISGITFKSSFQTSVLMNDPRAPISFEDCTWEDNTGTSVIFVDGAYVVEKPTTTTTSSTIDWSILMTTEATTSFNGRWLEMYDDDGKQEESTTMSVPSVLESEGEDNLGDGLMGVEEEEDRSYTTETASTASNGWRLEEGMEKQGPDVLASNDQDEYEWKESVQAMRFLDGDDESRSAISIDRCSFSGNTVDATIMVKSIASTINQATTPRSHSVTLKLDQTTFTSEDVSRSIIVNSGAHLESSRVLFANNTAGASIIEAEMGASVEVSRTEFSGNDVTDGGGSMVVLDGESEMERSEDNCSVDGNRNGSDGGSVGACNGIFEGGECVSFGTECIDREAAVPTASPASGPTLGPTLGPSAGPSVSLGPSLSSKPSLSSEPSLGYTTGSPVSFAPLPGPKVPGLSPNNVIPVVISAPNIGKVSRAPTMANPQVSTAALSSRPTSSSIARRTPRPSRRPRPSRTPRPTSRFSITTTVTTTATEPDREFRCKGRRPSGRRPRRRATTEGFFRKRRRRYCDDKTTDVSSNKPLKRSKKERPNKGRPDQPDRQPDPGPKRPRRSSGYSRNTRNDGE